MTSANGTASLMDTTREELDPIVLIGAQLAQRQQEAYTRFREMDEYNTRAAAQLQALEAAVAELRKQHQERNAEWGRWELANRSAIDALRDALAGDV